MRLLEPNDSGRLAEGWSVDEAADWMWTTVHPTHYHHPTAERGWTANAARQRILASLERELLRES